MHYYLMQRVRRTLVESLQREKKNMPQERKQRKNAVVNAMTVRTLICTPSNAKASSTDSKQWLKG